ncbi:MAG: hypothetical protein D3923_16740 [Candidatus Electrothrix sp. AR3]|nr:hypothetical protein [Candidatus Electrothrix sp. AR3]
MQYKKNYIFFKYQQKEQSMSLLIEYHLYIMIAILVGLIFLPPEHRKKKPILFLIVILAFSIGYGFIMDEPITKMPSRINRVLNESPQKKSENVKYYKDPAEQL